MATSLPYASGSETSRIAAEYMADKSKAVAERIWWYIISRGPGGATADEAIVQFQGIASHTTVSARMTALKYCGLIMLHPDKLTRTTRAGLPADVWLAREDLDFQATYQEPPPRNRKAETALLEAARAWVLDHGSEPALEALLDAAWEAFGEGQRPKPGDTSVFDDLFGDD